MTGSGIYYRQQLGKQDWQEMQRVMAKTDTNNMTQDCLVKDNHWWPVNNAAFVQRVRVELGDDEGDGD